jgi:hypothetical protein
MIFIGADGRTLKNSEHLKRFDDAPHRRRAVGKGKLQNEIEN